ncbi:hypothetical protein N7478_004778 [Penicillium angulare]|uniref:uncharacterized protein n=1 Tax=Penicillium angulare TaxID=116970 RepID=UPI0025414BB7|nr:uncharacterized protein N7478_004778 [Penicillium angulare]KAJ5279406.1 hypothetical protein N7478_004778 [Penicillium angulare]
MRFILLAVFAFVCAVMAAPDSKATKVPNGSACKQDGSMGNCESNFCLQTPTEVTGRIKFFTSLYVNVDWITETVANHLGLSASQCEVVGVEDWLHGSFNVCVPVDIKGKKFNRVLIRFPLPYHVGENVCPGNSDEKLRCEAGTYAWMQDNCPDVPILRLHGFGLSSGQAPDGIFWIFHHQLKPRFTKSFEGFNDDGFQEALCCFWSKDLVRISIDKMKDREQYDAQLKEFSKVTDEQEDHDEAVEVKEEDNNKSSESTG